ncbi:methyltransferase [Acidithiobacillus ferrooxidans]|uniref:methyltransferase n=1 Tax=Acidithiobacillus ferrooxidans TaxID=920 RepID=UPI001C0706DE|nr:methyltransferase [Acidithiobacillus ferrooxidans]MBU2856540.1 methyltransferase [Acidithiobacillus ferrooxidans]MBU2861403.1 methyltransferase [Acidithiobacillus ferrooxidans]
MGNKLFEYSQSMMIGHQTHIAEISREAHYKINGLTIYAPPGIYHPTNTSSSLFLLHFLEKINVTKKRILEIGAGTGVISIYLAKNGNSLISSDISELCCACMCWNSSSNGVTIDIIKSNMWENISDKTMADIVIFNPPLLDKKIENETELSLCDPDGKLVNKFLSGVSKFIKPTGDVYLVHSNISKDLPQDWRGRETVMDTTTKIDGAVFNILKLRPKSWN